VLYYKSKTTGEIIEVQLAEARLELVTKLRVFTITIGDYLVKSGEIETIKKSVYLNDFTQTVLIK